MILFRPVGVHELELIAKSGFRSFPPRLAHQPIFYPVLTEAYAHEIARDWNAHDAASGFAGFVTRFEVEDEFVARYPVQAAGASRHRELWVPAEDLTEFNAHLVGEVSVTAGYPGPQFSGELDPETSLPEGLADKSRQFLIVYRLRDDQDHTQRVQRATLTTDDFGIENTHGLFGSDEWWHQIAVGELARHTLRGTITRVYMGSMRDWPEFEVCNEAGELSRWTREVNRAPADSEYRVGRRVEIDYVLQRHRPRSFDGGAETKVVLEIRIAGAV